MIHGLTKRLLVVRPLSEIEQTSDRYFIKSRQIEPDNKGYRKWDVLNAHEKSLAVELVEQS